MATKHLERAKTRLQQVRDCVAIVHHEGCSTDAAIEFGQIIMILNTLEFLQKQLDPIVKAFPDDLWGNRQTPRS